MSAINPRRAGRPARLALSLVLVLVLLVAVVWAAACGNSTTSTTAATVTVTSGPATSLGATTTSIAVTTTQFAKLDKLTLVAPPGPMAIPLTYMAVNNTLADVANKTELVVWENADQLKAIVAGKQGDFVTMPSNNAALFYNKGLQLRLLDISVWNITYLVTSDA
jgi:hypothetical protein